MNDGAQPEIETSARHPLIGAEVRGVDRSAPLDDEAFERIGALWTRHQVLLFRDQPITDAQQIAFARRFGDLEVHPSLAHRSSRHPEIDRVANVDEAGKILPGAGSAWQYLNLTWLWHSDSSFREMPSMGSILHGLEVTDTGGETLFANLAAAHDALDEETRAQIVGLRVVHSHDHVISLSRRLSERADRGEYTELPPVTHPLVQVHPVIGSRSLFISPHTMVGVEGMAEDDSRALLDALIQHASADRFVYRHRWRQDDVLMWDNRSTMHAVTPYDHERSRRVLHRATIVGTERPVGA